MHNDIKFDEKIFIDYIEGEKAIKPTNVRELSLALNKLEEFESLCDRLEVDSNHPAFPLFAEQQRYIAEYMSEIDEYDNAILSRNISYLTKKNGIGIGDLEKILGISAGYISRTAKGGNSGKKMSIDNVWKIARIFGVELSALLEKDLKLPNKNSELLANFLEKVRHQTEENKIHWHNYGGVCYELDKRFAALPFFVESKNSDEIMYRANHLNSEARFLLADDIYSCKDIIPGKEILMVAYIFEGKEDRYHADFYFVTYESASSGKCILEKAFFTIDDCFGNLDFFARNLMNRIQQQEMDATITPDVRRLIADYLN